MGTSLTPVHKLIKADDNEFLDVNQLNQNWDLLDKLISMISVKDIPAGKTPIIWFGRMPIIRGAGGENRETPSATDGNGVGGIWFGYDGLPKLEGLSFAYVGAAGHAPTFLAKWVIEDANTTRIKFQGRRINGGQEIANGYGGVDLFVAVVGW